jgi:ASC-1-like (ASCH) protein
VTTRREISISREYLELIASGIKTVEVRVGYPGMRRIQPGQELTFASGDLRVPTVVKRVTEYPTFDAMLDSEDSRSIGGALGESRDELLAVIRGIYPPEKERLGVLAIEIQVSGPAPGAPPDAGAPCEAEA